MKNINKDVFQNESENNKDFLKEVIKCIYQEILEKEIEKHLLKKSYTTGNSSPLLPMQNSYIKTIENRIFYIRLKFHGCINGNAPELSRFNIS